MLPSTFQAFLIWAGTTGGATALTYLAIQTVDKILPQGLTGNQKFYTSFVLAVLIPVGAYAGEVNLGWQQFSADGLWAAILVTIFLAQTIHRGTSAQASNTLTLASAVAPLLGPAAASDLTAGNRLSKSVGNWTAAGSGLAPPAIAPSPPDSGGAP